MKTVGRSIIASMFALAALVATGSPAQAACTFSMNMIAQPGATGFGLYVEGVAVDCRDKNEAFRALAAGMETMRMGTLKNANPLKPNCFKVPTFEEIDCKESAAQSGFVAGPK